MKKREWIAGIDILKIVSMLMIVTLHTLGHGGVLDNVVFMSRKYQCAWLLEIFCYGAVNCYALISGFLEANFRVKKVIVLWIEVLFYSILISVIMSMIFGWDLLSKEAWIYTFFPVFTRKNWYISAYIGMLCFVPFLKIVIDKIEQKTYKKCLMIMFLIYSVLPTIVRLLTGTGDYDAFGIKSGYGTLWLIILYLTGAYIQRYQENEKKPHIFLIGFLSMSFITILFKLGADRMNLQSYGNILVSYTSPTIVLGSVMLLIFSSSIKIKQQRMCKIIRQMATASLGVYLIHDNDIIRMKIISNIVAGCWNHSFVKMFVKIFGVIICIYVICTLIEIAREKIFKALNVDGMVEKLIEKN